MFGFSFKGENTDRIRLCQAYGATEADPIRIFAATYHQSLPQPRGIRGPTTR